MDKKTTLSIIGGIALVVEVATWVCSVLSVQNRAISNSTWSAVQDNDSLVATTDPAVWMHSPTLLSTRISELTTHVEQALQEGAKYEATTGKPPYMLMQGSHAPPLTQLPLALLARYPGIEKNINARLNEQGDTALFLAARNMHVADIQALLQHGADINIQNNQGITVLFAAVFLENWEVVKQLLDHGADVHIADKQGITPLHWAATSFYTPGVQWLLDQGARVNAQDAAGDTPLFFALRHQNSVVVIELLLKNGADVYIVNRMGETPWQLASSRKEVVYLLLQFDHATN